MSKCCLCGEKTKWLSSTHDECIKAAENTKLHLSNLARSFFVSGRDWAGDLLTLRTVREGAKLTPSDRSGLRSVLLRNLSFSATERSQLEPMDFSEVRERQAALVKLNLWPNTQELLDQKLFGFMLLELGGVLCEVRKRLIPAWDEPIQADFNLHADEAPVFFSGSTDLAEYRSQTSRTYQSVGLPSVLGMSYRVGMSTPEANSSLRIVDHGTFLITTKNIYFGGPRENFRLPIQDVIRFEQYTDAVGVYPSHGAGKILIPQFSGAEVGWFYYGLLSALSAWD